VTREPLGTTLRPDDVRDAEGSSARDARDRARARKGEGLEVLDVGRAALAHAHACQASRERVVGGDADGICNLHASRARRDERIVQAGIEEGVGGHRPGERRRPVDDRAIDEVDARAGDHRPDGVRGAERPARSEKEGGGRLLAFDASRHRDRRLDETDAEGGERQRDPGRRDGEPLPNALQLGLPGGDHQQFQGITRILHSSARRGLPALALPSTLSMFMRSHLLLTGALASLTAIGCVAPPDDRPDAEATSSTATAVVVVERTVGPGDAVRGDAVIARFVRVRQGSVDEQALRIAGASGFDRDLPAVGTCSTAGFGAETQAALQPRSVDLLDVGVLTVDGASNPGSPGAPLANAGRSTVLLPRSMPDPTGVVSGVFYSARSAEAFTPAARLQFHTSGGPDMAEGFRVDVPSPRDVSDVHVAFASASPGSSPALEVSWEADAVASEARDVVYVDVLGPSSRLVTRCATLDVGQLAIPGTAVGNLEDGQLAVHRLHRESFRAKGIEPGEIRFDIARVIAFHRGS
jgi:hypothetical protein